MNDKEIRNDNNTKSQTVYLIVSQDNMCFEKKVRVSDVAKVHCSSLDIENKVKSICIYEFREDSDKDEKIMMPVTALIKKVHEKYPQIEINSLGESEFIIDRGVPKKNNRLWNFVKAAFICLIVFSGSAFTIMTFNEDVSVGSVFELLYKLFDSENLKKYHLLEISYSFGIGTGIMMFFNHFSINKAMKDPTPLQIEIRKYENDMNNALLSEAGREGRMQDD